MRGAERPVDVRLAPTVAERRPATDDNAVRTKFRQADFLLFICHLFLVDEWEKLHRGIGLVFFRHLGIMILKRPEESIYAGARIIFGGCYGGKKFCTGFGWR